MAGELTGWFLVGVLGLIAVLAAVLAVRLIWPAGERDGRAGDG
jgi:hypothetical protein